MSRDLQHVRWAKGRFVHFRSLTPTFYATECRRVMPFHRDRAIPTTEPVTCRSCLTIGERMRWS